VLIKAVVPENSVYVSVVPAAVRGWQCDGQVHRINRPFN